MKSRGPQPCNAATQAPASLSFQLAALPSCAGPCAFVQSWAAFIIGAIGGLVYFIASKVNLHVLKV